MANSVITLDNVSFRYPDAGRDALSGVSLSIEAGSFIAVLGHNGSGKSTLSLPSLSELGSMIFVPKSKEAVLMSDENSFIFLM